MLAYSVNFQIIEILETFSTSKTNNNILDINPFDIVSFHLHKLKKYLKNKTKISCLIIEFKPTN